MIEHLGIDNYKYSTVLQADTIKMVLMKDKTMKEDFQRVKRVLYIASKLNGENTITVNELKGADRKTRNLLTLNGALHARFNTDRLYVAHTEGSRSWWQGWLGV